MTEAVKAKSPRRPLEGLRVLEMGQLLAGPFASVLLAWFGAEVIKIESPSQGDPLRAWRSLYKGTSLWWYILGRNKKSVSLNLRTADGQAIVRRLVEKVDVVLENFKPGTMEKWGLGYEDLKEDQSTNYHGASFRLGTRRPVQRQAGFCVGRGSSRRVTLCDRISGHSSRPS